MQPSELWVVGLGTGHLEQLSLNGLGRINEADLILHDSQLSASVRSFWSHKSCVAVYSGPLDSDSMEGECRKTAEAIRSGLKVVRLCVDDGHDRKNLDAELKTLRRLGIKQRFFPSLRALHREAWDLRLPWLSELLPSPLRVVQTPQVKGDRGFWRTLANRDETLALDVGAGLLQNIMDQLLHAGADPERPVALVAYHPTQNPMCWLTTLEEVDELLPQWKPTGATIVYIGTWPHTLRDLENNKSFWGPLEAAAETWLRAQRA